MSKWSIYLKSNLKYNVCPCDAEQCVQFDEDRESNCKVFLLTFPVRQVRNWDNCGSILKGSAADAEGEKK